MFEIQVPLRAEQMGCSLGVLKGAKLKRKWQKQPLLNLVGIQIVPRVFALWANADDIALADCPIGGINTHSMARPRWVVPKIGMIRFQRQTEGAEF